ncbi:MAG: glycosyltransferase family 4 protein [Planctomycetota bacterium]|nr:glycosyltransferase family 4 protein [Planctomycetota bacterium]
MPTSLRVALLVDPLTLRTKGGEHPPRLAEELLGRGHVVRGFGAPPNVIPRSGEDPVMEEAGGTPLLRFRPDVVVAYDALSPAAMLGARTARKLKAALVLVEADPPGGGRWYQRVLWRVGELLWGRYVRRTAHALVALDPVARRRALEKGFEPGRITILPYGVNLTRFRPGLTSRLVAQHHIRGRILLYTGRIELNRGLETLISAFARTVGQRHDWSLVLAGDGSARMRLRAMCDRLGVGARVRWLARPRPEELPGLMGASTLLAVPALEDEVLGRQIARAMACGLPVLASDLERLRFLVEPEATGLVAPPGDVTAWSEMIRRAAGSPMARQRWGRNARRQAEERLSWPHVAEAFEGILLDAVPVVPAAGSAPSAETEEVPAEG